MLAPTHRCALGLAWLAPALACGGHLAAVAEEPKPAAWIELSTTKTFDGWRKDRRGWISAGDAAIDPANNMQLAAGDGDGVLVSNGDSSNLESRAKFQDVDFRCEFLVARDSNSGVKLNGLYEIQIRDTHGIEKPTGDSCGGVYPRAEQDPDYHQIDEGVAPAENAARPAGEWQLLELTFISPRFDAEGQKTSNARFEHVVLNGKEIHAAVDLRWPTGHAWDTQAEVPRGRVVLQGDHGPIAFRNVKVRPVEK